jgi:hypothetical protein
LEAEAEADRLLGLGVNGTRGGEYPFCTERRMREKTRAVWDAFAAVARGQDRRREGSRRLGSLVRSTPLTECERAVIALVRAGRTRSEIAEKLGIHANSVPRVRQRAVSKLARTAREKRSDENLTSGEAIARTYWEQVKVPVYAAPSCCAEGRERCAKDGLCDQRWYLFVDPVPYQRER